MAGEDGHRVRQVVAQKVFDYEIVDVSWELLVLLDVINMKIALWENARH